MNSQVCVNCCNEKPVNSTDNRLVTESCGHVKCMDCLLHEKTGCVACLSEKSKPKIEIEIEVPLDEGLNEEEPALNSEAVETDDKSYDDDINKEVQCDFDDFYKRKKPETEHIKIETGKPKMYCKSILIL